MNRSWLERFYSECGGEISLAHSVHNQTNNWGVTLGAAVLGAILIGSIRVDNGDVTFLYPNSFLWYYAIISWIILLRFLVRSCFPLANLYRWNMLRTSAGQVLSLPEDHPSLARFQRNFAATYRAYYKNWSSPVPRTKLVWQNLKLMFLWFITLVLLLIVWGGIALWPDRCTVGLGIALFLVPTAFETLWFIRAKDLKHQSVEKGHEPDITELWLDDLPPQSTQLGATKAE